MSTPSGPPPARPTNRLLREKSPYLLQHARNPVDWYPWGEEAFARARAERKPILLSIGYSTCHWCHVMERESFEDAAIAERLNRSFVAIKVDREERPDVDHLYMTAAQAMGLGGGWPLNLFLTPELDPFYGGTYFPPEPRHGRPSFRQILDSVERAWTEQPARIEESGRRVLEALAGLDRAAAGESAAAPATAELFDEAYRHFEQTFDSRDGGFGPAPKFPSVVNLEFLLRVVTRDPARAEIAREMVVRQLDAMRAGGIHDHLGGGFHRYATDARWLVPHFEKMLYDQAQLASIYLDAFQVTGRAEYAETARGIFGYVMRDLSAGRPAGEGLGASGAFCSAEDADSEGEEGRFYVWTPGEIAAVLGADEAALVDFVYGISPAGNFEQGATILSLVRTNAEAARRFGLGEPEVARRLDADRARLLEARGRRVRPSRDDKVIASWNGLMISALARGARILDDPALAARAADAAGFVWAELRAGSADAAAPIALARRWRDGEAAGAGQLADYAAFALGCLDLYEATFDPLWLERAGGLVDACMRRFLDAQSGGFFESPAGADALRVRLKEGFDGAEIAGNSLAAEAAQRLGSLLGRREWLEAAERTFEYYGMRLSGGAYAMPRMLAAMDLAAGPPRHVVVAGRPEDEDTRALVREFRRRYRPRDLLLLADGGERSRRLADLAPFAAALTPVGGRAAAYVCVDYACRLPVTDVTEFAAQLDEMERTR